MTFYQNQDVIIDFTKVAMVQKLNTYFEGEATYTIEVRIFLENGMHSTFIMEDVDYVNLSANFTDYLKQKNKV